MSEEKNKINIKINDGLEFFAHEMSANFNPTQFTLDFRCITPRTDPRSQNPSLTLKHNVVMVDPWHAKEIHRVLDNVIKKYEEKFGKIKKPKAVEKHHKEMKKQKKQREKTEEKTEAPNYLG
ncbi:DUF3467 domain-containing protein [Candidatus Woesearchaeota archaeon]|nr:DUF3467 domain-containing protein [Candidatus Woesearchaeota archaeon]